ncbi:hypothetical protein [Kitasatospora mediocidica]|uniref:hypothetical protein n=1 Tax=Kitasatospora mediocidica TaxID=58352 RepID=UPI000561BC0B|nr:hypothetical protein [Kitasatospora mediocidica]
MAIELLDEVVQFPQSAGVDRPQGTPGSVQAFAAQVPAPHAQDVTGRTETFSGNIAGLSFT